LEQSQSPRHHGIGGLTASGAPAGRFRALAQALFSSLSGMRSRLSRLLEPGLALAAAIAAATAWGAASPLGKPDLDAAGSARSKSACWAMARLKYGGGGDWYAGPTMLTNLSRRLRTDLGLPVCAEERQVALLDGNLYEHPILFMTGHGNVAFSEEERKVLREYLMRGGLLFADDNYGMDSSFRREMKILFPNHPLSALSSRHPVFSSHHRFPDGLPKVHQHDGKRATAYGITVEGRTVVFYSHEGDLGNGWEDPEVHKDPPEIREAALRMGVNVVAWFLQGAGTGAQP
jgi:hypothetical protein